METKAQVKKQKGVAVIAIIVIIALLLALMIPTWMNLSKQAKLNAEYQEKNDQQIAALAEKLENTSSLTKEEVQDAIATEIKKYHDKNPAGLTEAQVKKVVTDALKNVNVLTEAKVQEIVDDALENVDTGLTEYQVKRIVSDALKNASLTEAKVKEIVNNALKDVSGLTEAQVKKIVADALASVDTGLTEEEVKEIITAELNKLNEGWAKVSTGDELKAALAEGKNAALTGNVDLKYIIVPADTDLTLDLNGKTLSVYEIEVQGNGKLLLKNGKVSVDGYVYVGDAEGVMIVENVDVKHNNNDGNCVRNYGTTTISNSAFTATSTVDGEALLVNWGTMVVNDSEIISVAKVAKPKDYAVYNSGTMTLNRVKVTANGHCVMNVDLKEDDGFTAITTINGGTYTSKGAVVDGSFDSIYVVKNGSDSKVVLQHSVQLVTPVQDAGIKNNGELAGVSGVDYYIVVSQ